MLIRNAALPVWRAKWIDPELPHDAESKQPASYIRRRFPVDPYCIQLEAGKLTIRPYPHSSLGHAEAKWLSPMGEIRSEWRYENDRILMNITVPVPAEIMLPDGENIR